MSAPARIAPLLGMLLFAACTNPYDPGQRAAGGALIGAGTGAAIGGMAGGPRGLAIGALAGGLGSVDIQDVRFGRIVIQAPCCSELGDGRA